MRILKNKFTVAALAAVITISAVPCAMAVEGSVNAGKNFTDVNIGIGQQSEGLYLNGGWVKNTENGREKAGAETGINLKAGAADVNLGVQANYIKGNSGDSEGVVFPVGAGVKIPVASDVGIYGSLYTAPRQLSNTVKSYLDADAGISWQPVSLVTLKAGYRYIGMDTKGNSDNQRLVEGPYVGGQLSF